MIPIFKKLILILAPLLLLLTSRQPACAFYDPGLQRWISRDPFLEGGFESVRKDIPAGLRRLQISCELVEGPNLYTLAGNDAVSHEDSNGLALVPCPSEYVVACGVVCGLEGKQSVAICQVWLEPGGHIHIWTNCQCYPFRCPPGPPPGSGPPLW